MNRLRLVTLLLGIAFVGAIFLPQAKADEWDKKTIVTFSAPVELPGVVLPPGTYVFKLADSSGDRNIVQVFNKNESHVFATVLAVPDYRMEPADKTIITFEERAKGTPEAIRAWFYPGSVYGEEFVYPRARAAELAKANNQHVPAMPAAMGKSVTMSPQSAGVQAMKQAPVTAIQPSGTEVPLAEVHPQPLPAVQAPPVSTQEARALPKELPKTGSFLPLFLVIGTVSLTGSLVLKLAARNS